MSDLYEKVQGNPNQGSSQPATPVKACRKCGASIPKYSARCPICGADVRAMPKRPIFWVLLVLLLGVLSMGACSLSLGKSISDHTNPISSDGSAASSGSSASDGSSNAATASQQKYSIADEQLVDKGYGMYAISGTFTNTTGKSVSYVQLEYVLKDAGGAQIGTAYANTTNLDASTPWKYQALCTSTGSVAPASFELKSVSGF